MSVLGNLELGKSGLSAAQLGQTVTGHNISNANNEEFSRQRVDQSADSNMHNGRPLGARIDGISRLHDQFNSEKLVSESSNLADWQTRSEYMQSIESIFQDSEGKGVLEALTNFWNAWAASADQPESLAIRQNLIVNSEQLTDQMVKLDQKLADIQESLTADMLNDIQAVNSLAKEIADLNKQIHRIEALKGNANDLKDKRDELIQQMSQKVDINWFYNKQNMIDVQLSAGMPLVRGVSAYQIEPYYDTVDPGMPVIGYQLDEGNLMNVTKQLQGGSLKAIKEVRDGFVQQQRQKLLQLANALADNINSLHAAGTGLNAPTTQVFSNLKLSTAEANLPLVKLTDGDFNIKLIPNSSLEEPINLNIAVNAGVDTMTSIIEKINQAGQAYKNQINSNTNQPLAQNNENQTVGQNDTNQIADTQPKAPPIITASLNQDGEMLIESGPGYALIFDKDSSGFLGQVGINSFFMKGTKLSDLKINPNLAKDPNSIALGYDQNPGDNSIALAVHDLQFSKLMQNNSNTIDEFYRGIHGLVGSVTKKAMQQATNHKNIYDQYLALRNSVTGVNIDEEMTQMIKYQKAYDASAKYITTVDKMAETLINM